MGEVEAGGLKDAFLGLVAIGAPTAADFLDAKPVLKIAAGAVALLATAALFRDLSQAEAE